LRLAVYTTVEHPPAKRGNLQFPGRPAGHTLFERDYLRSRVNHCVRFG